MLRHTACVPLFQAYSFTLSVVLSLFTRKGPSSSMAPYPNDEHPGPAGTKQAQMRNRWPSSQQCSTPTIDVRFQTSVEPEQERLRRRILRRLHQVVEERAALLLVDGHVPAVLVEADAVVRLPRQRRDLVGRLQGALVGLGAKVRPCLEALEEAATRHSDARLVCAGLATPASSSALPGQDEFLELSLL